MKKMYFIVCKTFTPAGGAPKPLMTERQRRVCLETTALRKSNSYPILTPTIRLMTSWIFADDKAKHSSKPFQRHWNI